MRLWAALLFIAPAAAQADTLAFISDRDGVSHIYTMDAASASNVQQLTTGSAPEASFSWSADGRRIAFWRRLDGEAIYTMDADGSNVVRLSPPASSDIFPSWSPDGTRIVFTHVVDPNRKPPVSQIMVMTADGSNREVLRDTGGFNFEPRWSRDGQEIIFMSDAAGTGAVNIYTITPTGANASQLTDTASGTVNGDPAWSPDGQTITFGSNRVPGALNIFAMNRDGSNVRQLTHFTEPEEAGDSDLSSGRIAFEHDIGGNNQSTSGVPATVEIISGDGTLLVDTGQSCSSIGCSPRWKPGEPTATLNVRIRGAGSQP